MKKLTRSGLAAAMLFASLPASAQDMAAFMPVYSDAKQAYDNERFDEAIRKFEEAIAIVSAPAPVVIGTQTEYFTPHYLLGLSYFALRSSGDPIASCEKALAAWEDVDVANLVKAIGTEGPRTLNGSRTQCRRVIALPGMRQVAEDQIAAATTARDAANTLRSDAWADELWLQNPALGAAFDSAAAELSRASERLAAATSEPTQQTLASLNDAGTAAEAALNGFVGVQEAAPDLVAALKQSRLAVLGDLRSQLATALDATRALGESLDLRNRWSSEVGLGDDFGRAETLAIDALGFDMNGDPDHEATRVAIANAGEALGVLTGVQTRANEVVVAAASARNEAATTAGDRIQEAIGRAGILDALKQRPELQASWASDPALGGAEETAAQLLADANSSAAALTAELSDPADLQRAQSAEQAATQAIQIYDAIASAADRATLDARLAANAEFRQALETARSRVGSLADLRSNTAVNDAWNSNSALGSNAQSARQALADAEEAGAELSDDGSVPTDWTRAADGLARANRAIALSDQVSRAARSVRDANDAALQAAGERFAQALSEATSAAASVEGLATDPDLSLLWEVEDDFGVAQAEAVGRLAAAQQAGRDSNDIQVIDAAATRLAEAAEELRAVARTATARRDEIAAERAAAEAAGLAPALTRVPLPDELDEAWAAFQNFELEPALQLLATDHPDLAVRASQYSLRALVHWTRSQIGEDDTGLSKARADIRRCLDLNDAYRPPYDFDENFDTYFEEIRGEVTG